MHNNMFCKALQYGLLCTAVAKEVEVLQRCSESGSGSQLSGFRKSRTIQSGDKMRVKIKTFFAVKLQII